MLLNFGLAQFGARSSISKDLRFFKSSQRAVHGLAEDAVRFALVHFEWADLINQIVDHVAQVHGV